MKITAVCFLVMLVAAAVFSADKSAAPIRVQFEKGKSEATMQGKIAGSGDVTYIVAASAGQTMHITLTTKNTATYFNVFAPGTQPGRDMALFIGSTSGNEFNQKLTAAGDYTVQVYMMRSAARRNESAAFSLKIQIDGQADPSAK